MEVSKKRLPDLWIVGFSNLIHDPQSIGNRDSVDLSEAYLCIC